MPVLDFLFESGVKHAPCQPKHFFDIANRISVYGKGEVKILSNFDVRQSDQLSLPKEIISFLEFLSGKTQ